MNPVAWFAIIQAVAVAVLQKFNLVEFVPIIEMLSPLFGIAGAGFVAGAKVEKRKKA